MGTKHAEKVFRQLASVIMQLGLLTPVIAGFYFPLLLKHLTSLQFNKVGFGCLQLVGSGVFCVGEYFDKGILFPQARVLIMAIY
jgi:hypothetical protein